MIKKLVLSSCVGALAWGTARGATEVPPNVLFFLVDDLGYGDLGCTGSTLAETPNIDRFASENMLFSSAYAAAAHCSPSRAAIMTGQYPARLHITTWIGGKKPETYKNLRLPKQKRFLSKDAYTLAEYFQGRGYTTVQVGKWHLSSDIVPLEKHGFDYVIGHAEGASPGAPKKWYAPYPSIKDLDGPKGEYITDRLTDEAIGFIEKNRETPFFMMLQHYDVHGPLTAPEQDVKKYTERGRSLEKGIENATFLAMKENIDESFGRIVGKLKALNLYNNTIVVFFSDNGGVAYFARNGSLRQGKKWLYEGGVRVPLIMHVPGVTRAGRTCDFPVNGIDFFPTLAELTGGDPSQIQSVQDGVSFASLLRGSEELDRDALYWHSPQLGRGGGTIAPQGAVRQGPWKLIYYYGNTAPVELYNLDNDLSEKQNLAADYPERVDQMRRLLEKHLDTVDAQRVKLVK